MTSTDVRPTSEPRRQANLGRDSLGHVLLLRPNCTQHSNSSADQCNSCRPLPRLTRWSMTSTDVRPTSESRHQANLGRDSLGHVLWLYSRQKWPCVTAIWTLCCVKLMPFVWQWPPATQRTFRQRISPSELVFTRRIGCVGITSESFGRGTSFHVLRHLSILISSSFAAAHSLAW